MDEFHAARGVKKAATPRPFARAEPVAAVTRLGDEFMEANANTGLLVLKGDAILYERYQYGRTDGQRFSSASMAKTVLAMLVGIAVAEGKISIDQPVEAYVPRLKGHPYGETPIRHLLTMSSGVFSAENKLIANTLHQRSEGGVDTLREFREREAPAGTRFQYASGDSQALGFALEAAIRQPLATYLSEKIWQPMGAEANATWITDKGGHETGYCCINATLRDYARFGMLLAHYGALDGRQIIPAEWVKAATTPSAPHLAVGTATRNNGYGYQTWITHPTEPRFAALGLYGQAIMVDAATKLVVVHTAVWSLGDSRPSRGAQFKLFQALTDTLTP